MWLYDIIAIILDMERRDIFMKSAFETVDHQGIGRVIGMAQGRKQRVTLRQIAEETGYAVITVSKALRGEHDIAESTKQIICEKAREMGYVHNAAASMLRTGRSMLIAASVVDITNPYWSVFCRSIESLAFEKGYTAMFMNVDSQSEKERRAIKSMIQRGVDGVFIDPSADYEENVDMLRRVGTPFVLMGNYQSDANSDSVDFDVELGGYLIGKRLMQRGCKKILYMNVPAPYPICPDRERGLRRALDESDFPQENVIVCRMLPGQGAPVSMMQEIFAQHPDLDAISAFNDFSALQLLSTLEKMGKRVPEDVAVISSDNVQEFLETGLRLTSVDTSPKKRAEVAFDLLIRRIEGDYSDFPKRITLPVCLHEGQTC